MTIYIAAGYLFVVVILRSSESLDSTVNAECGENVTLPCFATSRAENYRSVTWYKVSGNKTSLLKKYQDRVRFFPGARLVRFGDKESLLVLNVIPEDSGKYECFLSAKVGGKNEESKVHLNISECVTPAGTTPAALTTLTSVMSSSSRPCMHQLVVSKVMVISSFSVIAFVKIILCFLSIWGDVVMLIRGEEEDGDEEGSELLLKGLTHQCSLALRVEGLPTGYCRDIHGQIEVFQRVSGSCVGGLKTQKSLFQFKVHDKGASFFARGTSSAVL